MPKQVEAKTQTVADLYDSPEGQLGPMMFGGHLHWGYWDESNADADFAAGADKLAQLMIDRVRIQPEQRFVDLGCGVGQPAIKLCKEKGCLVDGVTISDFQQQSATARALAAGLQDSLHFIHGNALSLPCQDQYYDGGWFFESIFHMGHREALLEAGRVLKPGATLILTDLPLLARTTDEFKEFVKTHIHSTFVSVEDYPALMAEAGFELVAIEDISLNVMTKLVPKLKDAMTEYQEVIAKTLSGDVEKTMDDWLYMFEYMSENLGYIIVTARKL